MFKMLKACLSTSLALILFGCGGGGSSHSSPPTITVQSPAAGSQTSEPTITVSGIINNYDAGLALKINSAQKSILSDGSFSASGIPTLPGENRILVELLNANGTVIDTEALTVIAEIRAEARNSIGPAGGTVSVTSADSLIKGAELVIPPSALGSQINFTLDYQGTSSNPEQSPQEVTESTEEADAITHIPFGYKAVSPALLVNPGGVLLTKPATLKIPFNASALPTGTSEVDVKIYKYLDNNITELTVIARTSTTATVEIYSTEFDSIVAAVQLPIPSGALRIASTPAAAGIIIDGKSIDDTTPIEIAGLSAGVHEVRLYRDGYNEYIGNVTMSGPKGTSLNTSLSSISAPIPVVTLSPDTPTTGTVTNQLFTVSGSFALEGTSVSGARGTIIQNGKASVFTTDENGNFQAVVLLDNGTNRISCRLTTASGKTGNCPEINVTYSQTSLSSARATSARQSAASENTGIRITLTWNTNATDVDMHVIDPDGNHAWYRNLNGIPGGALDRDDVDGYGPEVFTMETPRPGHYKVYIVYFSDNELGPSTASLDVRLNSSQLFSGSHTLSSTGAQWNAFEFDVGQLNILSAKPTLTTAEGIGDFTTDEAENKITLSVSAPADVLDTAINFEIKELGVENEFRQIPSTITDDELQFIIAVNHLINPKWENILTGKSRPIEFAIRAFVLAPDGSRLYESPDYKIKQDKKSQIRQEYVDNRLSSPPTAFIIPTATRSELVGAIPAPAPVGLNFSDLAKDADIKDFIAVDRSVNIFTAVDSNWDYVLRVTSGFRNPRANNRLHSQGSAVNSAHQTGNAVDFNPSKTVSGMPPEAAALPAEQREAQARLMLGQAACAGLLSNSYYVLIHGSRNSRHVHIEYKPNGNGNAAGGAVAGVCPKVAD